MFFTAVALLSSRTAWEQMRRDFSSVMSLQYYTPSMADLAVAVDNAAVNFDRTELVIVSDTFPGGTIVHLNENETITHLTFFLCNWINPHEAGVKAKPLAVISTSQEKTAALLGAVREHLMREMSESDAMNLIAGILILPGDISEMHHAMGDKIDGYPAEASIRHSLILDAEFDEQATPGLAPIITFTSSKGGPGKTTSSILMSFSAAYIAHKKGRRLNVVIVELDLKNATLAECLTIANPKENRKTILDYVNSGNRTESGLLSHLETALCLDGNGDPVIPLGSLKILFAPVNGADSQNITPENIHEVLYLLARSPEVDLVVCDTANEVYADDCVVAAYKESNLIIYVARDSISSFGPMPQKLSIITNDHGIAHERVKILVNESQRGVTDESLKGDLRKHGAGIAPLGVVPKSERITDTRDLDAWRAIFQDKALATAYTELTAACGPLVAGKEIADGEG